jgi:RNA polymerase sigma-70 factor (ECF subfamily)
MDEPTRPPADLPAVWLSEVRQRWPAIALNEQGFRTHLARVERPCPVFPLDTYLAAACAAGDPAAIRALEQEFIARVPAFVRRIDSSDAFAVEISQLVRVRLLVSEDDSPRIARYTGEVPLSAWIRVIAVRLALSTKRAVGWDGAVASTVPEPEIEDPELEYLRAQYREPFVHALQQTLEQLPKDDRTILRLHYIDGLNIDGIGRVFQVHRATVARWLSRIRSDVLAGAKARLAARLGTELDDADSVIGVLAGELDVTLSRMLVSRSA